MDGKTGVSYFENKSDVGGQGPKCDIFHKAHILKGEMLNEVYATDSTKQSPQ